MNDNMFVFEEEKAEESTQISEENKEIQADEENQADLKEADENSSEESNKNGKHAAEKKENIFKRLWSKFKAFWCKLKKWQKALIITVTAIVLVLAIAAGIFFGIFRYNYKGLSGNNEDLGFTDIIDERIVNVALFGIDSRDTKSFSGLSDSIMILSLNTETKKIKITSVMRDSLVPIEYDGKTTYNKINSAYSKGGPELAVKTLNKNFGLDISEYATVNFYGMTDIIDAVGGIEATITRNEIHVKNYGINDLIKEQCKHMGISADKYLIKEEGTQHLNGVQAVAYARIRHAANAEGTNNDQGRTERQRYVMEQLFNKATTLSKSQYITLAKSLIPCSETSLSYGDIISLATKILLDSPTFEQSRIPLDEYQMPSKSIPHVGSCVYFDIDYAAKVLHAFIYDDIDPYTYMEENGIEKNDWYANRYSSGSSSGKSSGSSKSSSSSAVSSSSKVSSSSSAQSSSSAISSSSVLSSSSNSSALGNSAVSSSSDTQTSSENTTTSSQINSSSDTGSSEITDVSSSSSSESSSSSSSGETSSSEQTSTESGESTSSEATSTSSEQTTTSEQTTSSENTSTSNSSSSSQVTSSSEAGASSNTDVGA